jgi:ADP-dependent phosphofructokinase/glucokinase
MWSKKDYNSLNIKSGMPKGEHGVNADFWETLYQSRQKPHPGPVVTGFNTNIDRVIPVTPDLLRSLEQGTVPGSDAILSRLKHSMRYCSADEMFVSDQSGFRESADFFSASGSLAIGGQAGIAAIQMRRLGIASVTCAVLAAGPHTCDMLQDAGIIPITFESGAGEHPDLIHLIFEHTPGLVPVADGVVPRSNRFIVSPVHDPSTVIIPSEYENSFLEQIATCQRAFLSGYQYLRTEHEFITAARQLQLIRGVNPLMQVHVECVSGVKMSVLAMMLRHITPNTDSIGFNEVELGRFMLALRAMDQKPAAGPPSSPVAMVRESIAFAKITGVPRVHLHTFGYYILVLKPGTVQPEMSRNALILAARFTADAAGNGEQVLSREGLKAYADIRNVFGPDETPGIFSISDRVVVFIPTYISQNSYKTTGLGDILSSTAFVADPF